MFFTASDISNLLGCGLWKFFCLRHDRDISSSPVLNISLNSSINLFEEFEETK